MEQEIPSTEKSRPSLGNGKKEMMVIRRYTDDNEFPTMYEIGHWMPNGNWNGFLRYKAIDGDVESAAQKAIRDLHVINGGNG